MPVHYYIDEDLDLLVAEAAGAPTDREVIEAFNRIVEETHGAALFKSHIFLADERAMAHHLSLDALTRIKDNVEAWGKIYPGRNVNTAIVVPGAAAAATPVAALWKALTEANPSVGAHVRLFHDKAAAIAWLKS